MVVISHDIFNERSGTAIVMALTSQPQRAGFPLTLEIEDVDLPKRSWVKISQIRTLSIERLGRRLGRLSPETLDLLIEGLDRDRCLGKRCAGGRRLPRAGVAFALRSIAPQRRRRIDRRRPRRGQEGREQEDGEREGVAAVNTSGSNGLTS